MLNLDDYFFLGKITKPHSFDGRVNIWLDVDVPDEYSSLEMVFVEHDNNLIPYFIESIQILNNKGIVSFQDVDDLEAAEALSQKDLYLPLSVLPKKTGNAFYFHEIIGFVVVDSKKGILGPIKKVLDYPNQALLQVFTEDNKEVLIPLSDEIIKKVDRRKKQISIEAPEGLLEIYL